MRIIPVCDSLTGSHSQDSTVVMAKLTSGYATVGTTHSSHAEQYDQFTDLKQPQSGSTLSRACGVLYEDHEENSL
jgi:hypothetical protein